MYMLIYESGNGNVLAKVSGNQTLEGYCFHFPITMKQQLSSIYIDDIPEDYKNYRVINNELVKMTEQETQELKQYGRILTEEERQLQKLKPTQDEVAKAENTIEILTLIQEVI